MLLWWTGERTPGGRQFREHDFRRRLSSTSTNWNCSPSSSLVSAPASVTRQPSTGPFGRLGASRLWWSLRRDSFSVPVYVSGGNRRLMLGSGVASLSETSCGRSERFGGFSESKSRICAVRVDSRPSHSAEELVPLVEASDRPPCHEVFGAVTDIRFSSSGPGGLGVDALSFQWSSLVAHDFPPLPLLAKVLRNVGEEARCIILLVASNWPTQPWFPGLVQLSRESPLPLNLGPGVIV